MEIMAVIMPWHGLPVAAMHSARRGIYCKMQLPVSIGYVLYVMYGTSMLPGPGTLAVVTNFSYRSHATSMPIMHHYCTHCMLAPGWVPSFQPPSFYPPFYPSFHSAVPPAIPTHHASSIDRQWHGVGVVITTTRQENPAHCQRWVDPHDVA